MRDYVPSFSQQPYPGIEAECFNSILVIRGHKILLDINLAELYGVETKVLKGAVRRNRERFHEEVPLGCNDGY